MKSPKRILAFALAALLIFSSLVFADNNYGGSNVFWLPSDPSVDDASEWTNYKVAQGIDPSIPQSISNPSGNGTLKFNKELWLDKNLVVYGDYSLISPNDYKAQSGGYYSGGEYRYHGYDVSGNKHTNEAFPNDNTDIVAVNDKAWVYRPWELFSVGYDVYRRNVGQSSVYNDYASSDYRASDRQAYISKWINEGLPWNFSDAIIYDGLTSHDLVNYLSIQTAPTLKSSGQGVMIHIDQNGNDWYQSFSVNPIQTKMDTPIECTITDILTIDYTLDGDVTMLVKVEGDIEDEAFYNDEVERSIQYNRDDIANWTMQLSNNVTGEQLEVGNILPLGDGSGQYSFQVTIPKSDYEGIADAYGGFDVTYHATAIANYKNGESGQDDDTKTKNTSGAADEASTADLFFDPGFVNFDIDAPHEILDVWNFDLKLTETDISHARDRYVIVDGVKLSEADEGKFLSGTYKFPNLDEDKIYNYKVAYVNDANVEFFYSSYVIVYDAIPRSTVRLTDYGKVNRKVTTTSDITLTPQFVRDHSSVIVKSFTLTALDGQTLYKGLDTLEVKEFLTKMVGEVSISVTVGNEYGSRNYTHIVFEDQDYIPDIVANLWNSEMSRADYMSMTAEGASIDDDTVGPITYEIYYDSDQDGETDTLTDSGEWNETVLYQPDKLGWYTVKLSVTEMFGQETIDQYITSDDYRKNTIERKFFVDNLIPMTKIYTNVEYLFPKLDVAILTDEGVDREQNNYLKNNYVDIINMFRNKSLDASVDIWDLYTYEYSQTAYKRTHDGKTYPKTTYAYNVDGYAGTLTRYDVDNYPYQVDEGKYVSVTDSKTATSTTSNTITISYAIDGSTTSITYSAGTSSVPSTKSYSSGGYTGTLSKTGASLNNTTKTYYATGELKQTKQYWVAYYSGTVYRTTQVWESDYVTYNDYYGDYSGTVYKYVKQSYTPSYDVGTNKIIIYYAKGTIINQVDFDYVHNIARDATVILVGENGFQGALDEDYFIVNTGDEEAILDQIVGIAKYENPIVNELAVLLGEDVGLSFTDLDAENDPIINEGFQYVQDAGYFDNSLGLESGAYATYNQDHYSTNYLSSFDTVGKFTIYRRIEDNPTGFEWLSKPSNEASIELVVHRKPIALATLDWDYDTATSKYLTTWVDQSYDPDEEYRDVNKGIINRKIRYKLTSSSTWIYEIPDNLSAGSYNLEYVVQDLYGVWSDTFTMNFTLSTTPPPQILASLRAEKSKFSILALPASENTEVYNIWTRYPYNVRLETALYNQAGTTQVAAIKNTAFTEGTTGTKSGNDIDWNDIIYTIPATIADGNYNIRIKALNTTNNAINSFLDLPFTVYTPINLGSSCDSIVGGQVNAITATTSIYAHKVTVELFRGTSKSVTLNMQETNRTASTITWAIEYSAPNNLTEGTYNMRFTATTPSGKQESLDKTFELVNIKVLGFDMIGEWQYWDGKIDYQGKRLESSPHRFLALEEVVFRAEILGNPESVRVELSSQLMSMTYTDPNGHTYLYRDIVGYDVFFPMALAQIAFNETDNIGIWEAVYILPLAPSTITWDDERITPPYHATLRVKTGLTEIEETISDVDLTGSIYDRISLQPNYR